MRINDPSDEIIEPIEIIKKYLDNVIEIKNIEHQLRQIKEINDKLQSSRKLFYDKLNKIDIQNIIGKQILNDEVIILFKARAFLIGNLKNGIELSIRDIDLIVLEK